ncbi:MAG: hypothetical protein COW30_10910 [Rhodospirillales bacterium CG15_BIG_FIL_POST_REV_8_21_14_020_66_15]|nr:MAG: hypothetical protein COW30_10910 [Rhodospirillales bacterium CG15_BIG_FIL_POST_REV_8_21_14_020_66_15]
MSEDATDIPATETPRRPPERPRKRQTVITDAVTGPGEEWMLTYMDTVTLLVTLFVMILSFSTFDKAKFEHFKRSMSLATYGAGILKGTMGTERKPGAAPTVMTSPVVPFRPAEPADDRSEAGVMDTLREQIEQQGLTDDIVLRKREGTVEMEINEQVLFPVASAELSDTGTSVLGRLANLLKSQKGTIAVEGHTDAQPIRTDLYPSNWELSGARASSVVRELISGGIAADRVRIVGYADTKPLAPNETAEGRQQNRRVNIILELPAQAATE